MDNCSRLIGYVGPTLLATVGYSDLGYQQLRGEHVAVPSREDLMLNVMQQWKASQVGINEFVSIQPFFTVCNYHFQIHSIPIPIKRSRELESCKIGGVSLAVNGRVGRRVTCVLDSRRTTMEILDLEGDWGSEEEGATEEGEEEVA
jgi:anaphase-promoting complex subunit 4